MVQDYSKYTPDDFKVWKLLYERLMPHLPGAAVPEYLEGIRRVNFVADRIPNFDETNRLLASWTGWELEVVPGLIPDKDFFELLANKRFPARSEEHTSELQSRENIVCRLLLEIK